METSGVACELQQLVCSDVEGDNEEATQDSYNVSRDEKVVSPVRSIKVSSSGETSQSSGTRGAGKGFLGIATNATGSTSGSARISYINEKRMGREQPRTAMARPRNVHKGKGCSMEQMTDIREQQEKLARLHFDLAANIGTSDPPLSAEGLRHSHTTMAQLVQRLEQLSVSIEKLHSSDK